MPPAKHRIDRRRRGITRPPTKPEPPVADPLSFNDDDEDDDAGVHDSPNQEEANHQVAAEETVVKQDDREDEDDSSSVANDSEEDYEEPDNKDDEDYQEESSEDNDDDFDDEDAYVPEESITSRQRNQPSRRRKQIDSYDEEEEDEHWESEEDSEVEPPPTKKKTRARTTKTSRRQTQPSSRRRRPIDSDDDEEEEEPWESDEDDSVVEPPTKKTRARTTRAGQRRKGRARSRQRGNRDDSSDEDEGYSGTPIASSTRRSTPSRASATRANKKLEKTFEDSDDEEDDDHIPMLTPKKRKKDDEEEEYVASNDVDEEEEEEEDEEDLSVEEEDSLVEDDSIESKNVDLDESLFSADESNNDDEKQAPSPALDIRYARRKRQRVVDSSDDDDDASVSDFRTTPGEKVASASSSRQQPPPKIPDCPSESDVVTFEELPIKHVCYMPPDQSSRQCFALETLHKIALTSKIECYGPDGKQTFLQPPHFRSAMSDDLLDQIASRFGRAALDLHGYFYNRNVKGFSQFSTGSGGSSRTRGEEYEYMVNFDGTLADTETFLERLDQYMSHLMGHQDVYCCPLCYTEAHRRLSDEDSADDESDLDVNGETEEDPADDFAFTHDPMSILGYLDNDDFKLASTFCFRKIVEVKRHLQDAHEVDTSVLDGTGLFKRFKIRESDGLLQRYLEKVRPGRTFQGNMRTYWSSGCNQMYIQLLHLMERTRLLKDSSQDDSCEIEDDERALLGSAELFVRSFQRRGKRLWDRLSSPYRKATKEELEDFIAEEDDYGYDAPSNPVFNPDAIESSATPEEQVIEALRQRRKRTSNFSQSQSDGDESGSDAYSEYSGDDAASSASEHARAGYYSEEEEREEEEDEWVKKRRPSKRASKPHASENGVQHRGKGKPVGTPASRITPASHPRSSSTKKHRRIIESDDDE